MKGVYKIIENDDFYRLHYISSSKKADENDLARCRIVQGVQFLTYHEGEIDVYWSPLEYGNHGDIDSLECDKDLDRISYHDAIRAIFGVAIK